MNPLMIFVKTLDIKPDHISVCICTFHRPELLSKALAGVTRQVTEAAFTFEVVVVDNDHRRSAEDAVRLFRPGNATKIIYDCEPEQNIALARNRAIQSATGNLIAFMDDDECPAEEWLIRLYRTMKDCKADGVLGPVLPAFPPEAPQWLIKSGLCERRSYQTGKILTSGDQLRTGNVLVHRRIFNNYKNLFEEQFGRTGGEDVAFFNKRIEEGYTVVWCEEAPVYEEVITERCFFSFHLKKYVRIGGLTGELMRKGTLPLWSSIIKSVFATVGYPLVFPVLAFCGKHILSRHLVKYAYHLSRLLGTLGIVLIRER